MTSRSDIARQLLVFGIQDVGQSMEQMVEAWEEAAYYARIHLIVSATQAGNSRPRINFDGIDAALAKDLLKEIGPFAEAMPEAAELAIDGWFDDCRWAYQ